MKIILYTNHCPKCNILKKMLDDRNIEYSEFCDIEKMINMGLSDMPVLSIDGQMYNFHDSINWVKGIDKNGFPN